MPFRTFNVLAITVAALSLGLSFAHVAEALPRLFAWSPELWREATVFGGQYTTFAPAGAALDLGAILLTAVVAYSVRGERRRFSLAVASCMFCTLALATWFAWVAPANAELAEWVRGPLPDNFFTIRDRWESGHAVIAMIKLAGFVALATALVAKREENG